MIDIATIKIQEYFWSACCRLEVCETWYTVLRYFETLHISLVLVLLLVYYRYMYSCGHTAIMCVNLCKFTLAANVVTAYTKSLWTWYLKKCLWEFHRIIYHLVAIGNREKLIRFWGQEVKGQGYSETTYSQINTLGGIFPPISWMHGHILMKLIALQLLITRPMWHWWHFQGRCSKVKITDNIFRKCTFPAET